MSPATAQTRPTTATAPTSRPATPAQLDIRISPLVDLHYFVRTGSDPAAQPVDPRFAEAVQAARAVEQALGGPAGWGFLEGNLEFCASAREAVARFGELPESFRTRGGETVALRAPAVRLAEAYARVEAEFQATIWPQHEPLLAASHAQLAAVLVPRLDECLAYMRQQLGLDPPPAPIPVYLVAQAPAPQGFTHRRRGGGGICFVGVADVPTSLLCEIVLHESVHALDIGTPRGSVLGELRDRLAAAGLPPASAAGRDVPHTLIFVQAAETVRRRLDPAHRDYGDVRGYYAKVPQAVAAVRQPWVAYLDGQLSRGAALERIIENARRQYAP